MKMGSWIMLVLASGVASMAQAANDCADYWQKEQSYTQGQTVSHLGRNYRANWWTYAMRPDRVESRSEWSDLGQCSYPQHSVFELPGEQLQALTSPSMTVGTRYRIHVRLPADYQPQRAYPVLYVADWSWLGQRETMQALLMEFEGRDVPLAQWRSVPEQVAEAQSAGEAAPVILVGIECPDELGPCLVRRSRDLTPTHSAAEDDYIRSWLMPDLSPTQQVSGGGANFGRFIRESVIPSVERRFKADPHQRGWLGTSLAGLWGADQLLNHDRLFSRYLLNSPSLWYDNMATLQRTASQSAASLAGVQQLYLSIGAEETQERPLLEEYATVLAQRQLNPHTRIIPDASHLLAPAQASRLGLPKVYPAK
ncbi:alpha/beta hydrolase-fold protein [Chitinibacter sp. FCG-7]|uniref:Alpha/beta hydrolase-fold protein n=1 Tax=Chitinibacter mangrovi TaxID=3153927 RepID=A0AAU7FEH2_9NEIS